MVARLKMTVDGEEMTTDTSFVQINKYSYVSFLTTEYGTISFVSKVAEGDVKRLTSWR
jgi:hypothetical protein